MIVGAVLGAAVAQGAKADILLLVLLGVLGVAVLGGGWAWEWWTARTRARRAAAQFHGVLKVIGEGSELLGSMLAWSRDHPYTDPSVQDSPAVVGADGLAKTEFLQAAQAWDERAEQLAWKEFGTAVTGLRLAPAVPPAADQYVHPHLEAAWSKVRGRVTWLADRVPEIMPSAPSPSHRFALWRWRRRP